MIGVLLWLVSWLARAAAALLATLVLLHVGRLCVGRCSCPGDRDLRTGVRRDGWFECWPHPVGDPAWDGTWQRPDRSVQPAGVLEMRALCPRGVPVILDWHTVGCSL